MRPHTKDLEGGAKESVAEFGAAAKPRRPLERVLMVAGGTGGHIFPLLAVAAILRARWPELEIRFLGTGRPLETKMIPAAGFVLQSVRAAGLKGIRGWKRIRNLLILPRTAWETAAALRAFKPQVVAGIGGYLAGPVMLEAGVRRIPTLLIEPNSVPGFTNRVLAPLVSRAAVGFERAARRYGRRAVVTGHAVRKDFFAIAPKTHVPPYTVLILGGSQGARAINRGIMDALAGMREKGWTLIHQTGEEDYNAVREACQRQRVAGEVRSFIENVPEAMARADLVVSRSGAAAVAELAAAGKASLLIPFPAAADQHQLENARVMEQAGAGRVIEQRQLTPDRLTDEIADLLSDTARLVQMEQRAKSLARPNAADRIADLIEEIGP